MRYLISAAAFVGPVLLAVAIGGSLASGDGGPRPTLPAPALAELRDFAGMRQALLDRYAAAPGEASASLPHLSLERFDRRGCDPGGQPWYRLAGTAVPCGLLRRAPAGPEAGAATVDGRRPTLVLPLTASWSYWELAPPPGPAPTSP